MNTQNQEENLLPSNPNTPETFPAENFKKRTSLLGDILKFIVLVLVIVVPIRLYIAQPFIVKGPSMEPTFFNNEYLIVNEISYRFRDPQRGEVVIFKFPTDQNRYLIKRIIGLPHETVEVRNGVYFIVNKDNPEGYELIEPYAPKEEMFINTKTKLDEDQFFVMGDNRKNSADSRVWGQLDKDLIVGTPLLRLYPLNRASVSPGKYTFPETSDQTLIN